MARGYPEPKHDAVIAPPTLLPPGRCAMCGKGPIDHLRSLCDACRALAGT